MSHPRRTAVEKKYARLKSKTEKLENLGKLGNLAKIPNLIKLLKFTKLPTKQKTIYKLNKQLQLC